MGILPLSANPQGTSKPLSKDDVIRLLKGDVSSKRVAELARERKIDFELTEGVEKELRQAGADDSFLAALREVAPEPVAATSPPPAPATLEIESTPGNVQVYVDDEFRGATSKDGRLKVALAPGTHRLRLSLEGYQGHEEQLNLTPGETRRYPADLTPEKPLPMVGAAEKNPAKTAASGPSAANSGTSVSGSGQVQGTLTMCSGVLTIRNGMVHWQSGTHHLDFSASGITDARKGHGGLVMRIGYGKRFVIKLSGCNLDEVIDALHRAGYKP
jgi:hypothetical protein